MNSSLTWWRWLALAIFVSTGSLLVLAHGFAHAGAATTAAILILSSAARFAVGDWHGVRQDFCDLIFMTFVGYIALSVVTHSWPDPKELSLLVLALLSYPAGRLFRTRSIDPVFAEVVIALSATGAAVAVVAMVQGKIDAGGKPNVFGEFATAPAQFMVPFVLAVGAILSRDKVTFRWLPAVLITAVAAVFAASMVRFTFIAAVGAGLALALVSSKAMRRWVAAGTAALLVTIAVGQATRISTAIKLKDLEAQSLGVAPPPSELKPPAVTVPDNACPPINELNTIEVRKSLYRDWLRLIVDSDLTGIGLDEFMKRSCHPHEQVHNDLLQIALEFGWPPAGLLAFLIVTAFVRLVKTRSEEQARFGLFALSFLVLMSMAHGRVSREFLLFFFVGYAVQFGSFDPRFIRPIS